MNIFKLFSSRATSAPVARERLQLLLAHERTVDGRKDLVSVLREEIIAVIARHVSIDSDQVRVKMDMQETVSTLEVDLEIRTPSNAPMAIAS